MDQQQPLPLPLQYPGYNNYLTGGPPAPPIHFDANTSFGVHPHHGQSSTPHQVVLGNHYNNFPQQLRQLPPPPDGRWSTGLFGAHGEYWNCLVTHLFPCITFGQIAEIVDEGTTPCCHASLSCLAVHICLGYCFTPMVTYVYRAKIRHKFNIPPGRCCGDFCIHFWCQCFALRQVMSTIHYSLISSS